MKGVLGSFDEFCDDEKLNADPEPTPAPTEPRQFELGSVLD